MDCLLLAEKLASKNNTKHTSIAPTPKTRIAPKKPTQTRKNKENVNSNNQTSVIMKPMIRLDEMKHDYIPPFTRIFTDKNLYHYFKRYIEEKKLSSILKFLETVKKFKDQFYSHEERRYSRHQKIIQRLQNLPKEYLKSVPVESLQKQTAITPSFFDRCVDNVMKVLQEREFASFIDSDHYIKWTLKYHNTEIY
ncbi:hypothetical protein GPJ56_002566 [Histomonas meleagridis]|uniref:uncharacterized protein n=1 Tax=Histomonas meleagridis TaxID=135588 RepID=UPI00355966B1|nr:hypothetical protein GPJ56_002566 [Histomonas meleagridis]KAH0801358.1 hypothetical protein GO595_005953 [Histomonas meleagridis]